MKLKDLQDRNDDLQERADTQYERMQERGGGGAGFCLECLTRQNEQQPSFDWKRTGANAIMSGVGMYLDHRVRMRTIQANQDVGWPTPISAPYIAVSYTHLTLPTNREV